MKNENSDFGSTVASANKAKEELIALEVQEQLEDEAIIKIQSFFRAHYVKKSFINLIKQHFVKIFNEELEQYIYKNKRTGHFFLSKPTFFGYEDLPIHRIFEMPKNYIPDKKVGGEGFALIITVQDFLYNNKIPNLPEQLLVDHKEMVDIFTHDLFCRFSPENVFSFINPKKIDFIRTIETLKSILANRKEKKESPFLVIYICTHVITAWKGEMSKPIKEREPNCYFLFKDSQWSSPENIASSSLSLQNLIELVNSLKISAKTFLLNHAHEALPPKKFGVTKLLYPPEDYLVRLADGCKAFCIGSCQIGSNLLLSAKHCSSQIILPPTIINPNASSISQGNNGPRARIAEGLIGDSHPESTSRTTSDINKDILLEFFRKDWKIPDDYDLERIQASEAPQHSWGIDRQTGEIRVKLPTDDDVNKYHASQLKQGIQRLLRAPVNKVKTFANKMRVKAIKAPCQHSLVGETNSFFGASIVRVLAGEASVPYEPTVSALNFTKHLYRMVVDAVTQYQTEPVQVGAGLRDESIDVEKDILKQNPMICIPAGDELCLLYPICHKCCQPPAPDQPAIMSVGRQDVQLAWANPSFDGASPYLYRISMRNLTRNYHSWSLIPCKGLISAQSFSVRNLPQGIKCQFRVECFSNGGWSSPSDGTVYVTPGEQFAPISFVTRWTRLAQGGALAIVDRLNANPYVREDYIRGLHLLCVIGQKDDGFHKGKIQKAVGNVAILAIKTYIDDPQIIPPAFLTLGYSLRGSHYADVEAEIQKGGIIAAAERYYKLFRNNTSAVNALQFLQSCLSTDVILNFYDLSGVDEE